MLVCQCFCRHYLPNQNYFHQYTMYLDAVLIQYYKWKLDLFQSVKNTATITIHSI